MNNYSESTPIVSIVLMKNTPDSGIVKIIIREPYQEKGNPPESGKGNSPLRYVLIKKDFPLIQIVL